MRRHMHEAPVLDCVFGPNLCSISGGLDQQVKLFDFSSLDDTTGVSVLGQHDAAVRCVEWSSSLQLAISGAWDGSIKAFDLRDFTQKKKSSSSSSALETRLDAGAKVLAMSMGGGWRLTVAAAPMCPNPITVWDLRNFARPLEQRESPLHHQIRSVATFPDNNAWAVGTLEGRCSVQSFADAPPDSKLRKKKFAFKCHRVVGQDGVTNEVHAVNALSCHPVHGTLASGGSDGFVYVWDTVSQKRLVQYHRYATSIASLDFSSGDGQLLAVAVSYGYEQGEKTHPADAIMIRTVGDEVRPK